MSDCGEESNYSDHEPTHTGWHYLIGSFGHVFYGNFGGDGIGAEAWIYDMELNDWVEAPDGGKASTGDGAISLTPKYEDEVIDLLDAMAVVGGHTAAKINPWDVPPADGVEDSAEEEDENWELSYFERFGDWP